MLLLFLLPVLSLMLKYLCNQFKSFIINAANHKKVAPVPWHTTKHTVELLGRHSGLLSSHCGRRAVFPALCPASGVTYLFKNLVSSTSVKNPMFTPHLKRTSLRHATIESPFLQLGIHVGTNCFRYRES